MCTCRTLTQTTFHHHHQQLWSKACAYVRYVSVRHWSQKYASHSNDPEKAIRNLTLQFCTKPQKADFESRTHQVPPPNYSFCCHSSWVKRSEQLTLVRWVSCADLLKKGSCRYAVEILSRKLNAVVEILKTYFPGFCATL